MLRQRRSPTSGWFASDRDVILEDQATVTDQTGDSPVLVIMNRCSRSLLPDARASARDVVTG
jgi:hypothetical protein